MIANPGGIAQNIAMTASPRRRLLIVVAALLFAGDLLLAATLLLAQPGETRPSQHLFVESMVFDGLDTHGLPWLNGRRWQVGTQPLDDLPAYARTTAARAGNMTPDGPILFLQLGPKPSFGQFLATMTALREQQLCHIAVPGPDRSAQLLRLCGKCVGHVCG